MAPPGRDAPQAEGWTPCALAKRKMSGTMPESAYRVAVAQSTEASGRNSRSMRRHGNVADSMTGV